MENDTNKTPMERLADRGMSGTATEILASFVAARDICNRAIAEIEADRGYMMPAKVQEDALAIQGFMGAIGMRCTDMVAAVLLRERGDLEMMKKFVSSMDARQRETMIRGTRPDEAERLAKLAKNN